MRSLPLLVFVAGWTGCRVLTSGLSGDVGEPPSVSDVPDIIGCSDGTREGFRDYAQWLNIAGCDGAFDQPGVVGSPDLMPTCGRLAGDSNSNRDGIDCSAADLCAANWHVCRDGHDVATHSLSGNCVGCLADADDEPRFFLVASGASPMGICSPDSQESNDLHGCGKLIGQSEAPGCAPLSRSMGFADCLATNGVWSCGTQADSLQEASVVTKPGISQGGVLCCRD